MINEELSVLGNKLSYVYDTKIAIRDAIVSKGVDIPDQTHFRDYANAIGYIGSAEPFQPAVLDISNLKTLGQKLSYTLDTKELIRNAIIAKGVEVPEATTFREYASMISNITESKTYGVKIELNNSNPETACTYIEDAVGMNSGWSNWKDTDLFSNIKPCILRNGEVVGYLQRDNYNKYEDGSASNLRTYGDDVMVEIPKIGYKLERDSSYQYIYVTTAPNKEGFCYAAHSRNTEGDCDKIYIGAYLGYGSGSKLYSMSDELPTTNMSLTNFRAYASSRGDGYELFSFYPLTLLQCLYMIIYKNRNSQNVLGAGYTSASSRGQTGATNSKQFCYASSTGSDHVKLLGIEDIYGNAFQWIDGIRSDSSRKLLTYYNGFSGVDGGTGYQYSIASGLSSNIYGFVMDIIGTNYGGFIMKSAGASSSTYYCDYGNMSTGACLYYGGDISESNDGGIFTMYLNSSYSSAMTNRGARLMYKHLSS